jgi:hypothetical protein
LEAAVEYILRHRPAPTVPSNTSATQTTDDLRNRMEKQPWINKLQQNHVQEEEVKVEWLDSGEERLRLFEQRKHLMYQQARR